METGCFAYDQILTWLLDLLEAQNLRKGNLNAKEAMLGSIAEEHSISVSALLALRVDL